MSVRVRRACLVADRQVLIELLRRYLTPDSDERRYDWLYRECPHGEARAWVATDAADGTAVGAAAAFTRRMRFDGKEKLACVLGDFWVDTRFRSLGPALQLQRACLEAVNGAPFAFCYDFPSSSMMAIYKRLGIKQSGNLVRFARPLRANRKIEKFVKSRLLARVLAAPVNFMLNRGRQSERVDCELRLHVGLCDEEFTLFDGQFSHEYGIATLRSAEYLNWRYLRHPSQKYELLTARCRAELQGYAVFSQHGDEASIVDVNAKQEPDTVAVLLSGVADLLQRRGVATVSMPANGQHPFRAQFERAGFRPREAAPVITYAPQGGPLPSENWYLMQGDRDS